ncbi:MAG: hypothetical protein AAF960_28035 [Bacteroidota bacterium]
MKKNIDYKKIWKTNDFSNMSWHDNKIHAVAFLDDAFELMFDIDYIMKWIEPKGKKSSYSFEVVPATLIFKNVWDLEFNLESSLSTDIQEIQRQNPKKPKNIDHIKEDLEYDWLIETINGEISFKSTGFQQYSKKKVFIQTEQSISLDERGGPARPAAIS